MASRVEIMPLSEWKDFEVMCETWQLPADYLGVEFIAKGAFGSVCLAFDSKKKRKVAIKRCSMIFVYIDKAMSFYSEMCLLSHFKHGNIVDFIDVLMPPNSQNAPDPSINVYLVFELCHKSLHNLITSGLLTESKIQSFIYQTLQGLRYIHSAGVAHRDINPYNLMVNECGILKIIDFGLASNDVSAGYVATWWSYAPEILLSWPAGCEVDIWAVGCVLFEMEIGHPLFTTTNASNVLIKMIDTLGKLQFENIHDKHLYGVAMSHNITQGNSLVELFESCNKDFLSFLEGLLSFDLKLRPTAETALRHSYLSSLPIQEFIPCPAYKSNINLLHVSIQSLKESTFAFIDNFPII